MFVAGNVSTDLFLTVRIWNLHRIRRLIFFFLSGFLVLSTVAYFEFVLPLDFLGFEEI